MRAIVISKELGSRIIYFSQWFLIASFFVFPISSTARSIAIALTVILTILSPNFIKDLQSLVKTKWFLATLMLVALVILGCFWGGAQITEKLTILEKYLKLLFLPVLVISFQSDKTRNYCIHAFLLAMLITSLIAVLATSGLAFFKFINPDHVFHNHILTGFMLALASCLSFWLSCKTTNKKLCAVYVLLILIFTYHLFFINTGRSAYIIYMLMMGLTACQIMSWRQFICVSLFSVIAIVGIYFASSSLQNSVRATINEWHLHQLHNNDHSTGYRLQFYKFSYKKFLEHPFIGNGTGGFTSSYRIEKPVATWSRRLLEPHSNYWLIAVEYGVVGILALLFYFVTFLLASLRLEAMRPIAISLIIAFMVGNLTDSLLLYSGSGYIFILFMALFLSEGLRYRDN